MNSHAKVHVFGASGSGTTTLGRALASALDSVHLDTDAYFWVATDPPFTQIRPASERVALLENAMRAWANKYDIAGLEMRSRALHEQRLQTLRCPVLRIECDASPEAWRDTVLAQLA